MSVFSDEMILYVGLIVAAVSILAGIIYYVIYKIQRQKLNAKFDVEYGEVQKKLSERRK